MSIIALQVFVSLILVAGFLVLLAYSIRHADAQHADRLSLLPMENEESAPPKPDAEKPLARDLK